MGILGVLLSFRNRSTWSAPDPKLMSSARSNPSELMVRWSSHLILPDVIHQWGIRCSHSRTREAIWQWSRSGQIVHHLNTLPSKFPQRPRILPDRRETAPKGAI